MKFVNQKRVYWTKPIACNAIRDNNKTLNATKRSTQCKRMLKQEDKLRTQHNKQMIKQHRQMINSKSNQANIKTTERD